jgi:hypothetical protein
MQVFNLKRTSELVYFVEWTHSGLDLLKEAAELSALDKFVN